MLLKSNIILNIKIWQWNVNLSHFTIDKNLTVTGNLLTKEHLVYPSSNPTDSVSVVRRTTEWPTRQPEQDFDPVNL